MCGICGVAVTKGGRYIDGELLLKMTHSMTHRGPDEYGTYCDEQVGLGSRRLSIIDLGGGKQPITNEDKTAWIVYNGELYNYRELREHLVKLGHIFRTSSDTEVILHLYEEYGFESLQHLNGIFAFAIWNTQSRELFIARDRTGIKPLYYTQVGDKLIFGSEMKVLLTHPEVPRHLDYIALNEYLSFEYVPSPRTILRNIYRLLPGHALIYRPDGTLDIKPYYHISFARSESQPPVDWRDYSQLLHDRLREVVRQEMVSDVPVGVLLSGGIDSSTVAAFMAQVSPDKIHSFSITFEDASFDESRYAKLVADHVGTQHHQLMLTGNVAVELTENITDFLDEPFADSSLIPTYLLSKFAREHVKVVLGGDGGDELFAGYPTLIAHRAIQYYERVVPRFVRSLIVPRLLKGMPVSFNNISLDFQIKRFLAGRGVPLQARHHRWMGAFMDEQKVHLLQDWIKPVLRDTYTQAYLHAAECDARQPLNQLLYGDMKTYLEGDILYKVDRASMAASLETRVPLLNRDLVDFVTALPLELKLRRFTGKYLLKKAMERTLPREVIYRKKKGFNMPVAKWFREDLRGLLLDMLSEDRINRQGIFQYGYIHHLIDEHFAARRDNRKELWTLLIFQLWYNRYSPAI